MDPITDTDRLAMRLRCHAAIAHLTPADQLAAIDWMQIALYGTELQQALVSGIITGLFRIIGMDPAGPRFVITDAGHDAAWVAFHSTPESRALWSKLVTRTIQ